MLDIINQISIVGAFFLSISYILGLLIVNLDLSSYGITRLDMLRLKYLVVGIIYSITIAVHAAISIPIAFLLSNLSSWYFDSITIFTYLGLVISYFIFVNKPIKIKIRPYIFITIWLLISVATIAVPMRIFAFPISADQIYEKNIGYGIIVMYSIVHTFFYGFYIHGKRTFEGKRPIFPGISAPGSVEILFIPNKLEFLEDLGIPLVSTNKTQTVLLIDQTQDEIIISTKSDKDKQNVFTLSKDVILGIHHLQ